MATKAKSGNEKYENEMQDVKNQIKKTHTKPNHSNRVRRF